MEKVFIYWDNSNIFISAREVAMELEGDAVRYRVRLHFRNMMELGRAGRDIERAIAAGSIPPELRHVWNCLENEGFTVQLLERGAMQGREQGVDQALQTVMLRDTVDYNGDPGIAVLLTGDGSGFDDGVGFHADLERMRNRGWRIEVLSWRHSCNRRMREWAEENGTFIALDDFYDSVTFLGRLPRPAHRQPTLRNPAGLVTAGDGLIGTSLGSRLSILCSFFDNLAFLNKVSQNRVSQIVPLVTLGTRAKPQ